MSNLELNLAFLLAQVDIGGTPATLLGIILVITGFFMPVFRGVPARPHDNFFSVAAVVGGFILIFQGWRLDPILQFGQITLVGITIYYTIESIQLRRIKKP